MASVFPTTLESVGEWLKVLNLSKYEEVLAGASVTITAQLHALTDDKLKEMGVTLAGHRKRLLLAIASLLPAEGSARVKMDVEMPNFAALPRREPVEEKKQAQQRANSTSSIFISSTIIKPDIDEIIFCVSVVIHDRIVQGEQESVEKRDRFPYFSEENNPLYKEPSEADKNDESKKKKRAIPSEETIFYTLQSVYECAMFPSECLIIALVYIERLSAVGEVPLLVTSWRPIVLASIVLAQKVWDDKALNNLDFSYICPMFTLKEINHLELKFLELIQHDVSVNASLYASYYFQLRTLCQRQNRDFSMKMLEAPATAALETRSSGYTTRFKQDAAKRHSQSTSAIPSSF